MSAASIFAEYAPALLLSTSYEPHGSCFLWQPSLLWANAATDTAIWLSYLSISATLVYLVVKSRGQIPFHWIFLAFGTFIVACGFTHMMEVITLWNPVYWVSVAVKGLTALASLFTAIALPLMLPLVFQFVDDAVASESRRRLIEEKNRELEAANDAKIRFLASMSHELRTPLNAIIGFSGTLMMQLPGPLNDEQARQLKTVDRSARHLLSLINDMLDVARIESGKLELRTEPVELCQLVQEVATSLHALAEDKGLRLETCLPEAGLAVVSDRRAVYQILINLVNNAIKYTDTGYVRIDVVSSRSNGSAFVDVDVVDSGIGIREEDYSKLFRAFEQVDSSNTKRFEGAGLGLHLSQKLAALIGGHLHFATTVGKGSTFTLTLPGAVEM